jgi:protein-S-isoprenylcysteine O-methyltransferase Ste14
MARLRTRLAWIVVVPFLVLARPAAGTLALGAALGVVGLVLRAWSAGTIRKNTSLTTSGPYAFTRNPLYLGSFLIATGLSLGGGHWIWVLAFIACFVAAYAPTVAAEQARLTELFGPRYREYAASVPALVPRLKPYRSRESEPAEGFRWSTYMRHREWEALVGAAAAWGVLAAKLWWPGP